ncbi:hypothetical protein PBV87_08815 [Niameybacter massiliensis]|uniref:Uncharacterized protein n=1 Tax=Holtiella tumoricola TaxID=3018743 RepID=A0AA42DM91_9FIRM|nr:hypothetical protein [Holtiella tumoricola]MDA3731574.1 hypothetical protein [Holtiella tumoricola]
MGDTLMKFPIIFNNGYEVVFEGGEGEELKSSKKPIQETYDLVIRAMSMDEYFEANTLKNQKEIWEYILEKQLVTPKSLKDISAWKDNMATLKYVVHMAINFTLEPYAELWLPFHTSYEELTCI